MSETDVRLVVVEVAIGEADFELEPSENRVQVRSRSLLWHKAQGMNLGAEYLIRQGFSVISFMDADTYPLDLFWGKKSVETMNSARFAQVAGRVRYPGAEWRKSICRDLPDGEFLKGGHDGAAWVAHAEFWTEVGGHFPYTVVGGDNRFLLAPLEPSSFTAHPLGQALGTAPRLKRALEDYHDRFRDYLGGTKVRCCGLDFEELNHGTYLSRRAAYLPRYRFYASLDPEQDLQLNADGVYEFTNDAKAKEAEGVLRLRELGLPWYKLWWENIRKLPNSIRQNFR